MLNEWHEGPARRVNPTDRQPRGNLGNFWVSARKNVELQLGCSFDRKVGVVPSEPGRLRLAAAIEPEQNYRRWAELDGVVRFCSHDDFSLESKRDPVRGPWFHGLRLIRRRDDRSRPPLSAVTMAQLVRLAA
jgi:hypothetical protein